MTCLRMPDSTGYQLPSAVPFSKAVDARRLTVALGEVIKARPVLRTRLLMSADGQPRQYADDVMQVGVPCKTMPETAALEYINHGFVRPFALFGHLPLCRFEVLDTETHTWLLMDFHHLIADGMTIANCLMKHDLPAAYDGRSLTVGDVALYQLAEEEQLQLGNGEYLAAKDYYRRLFADTTFSSLPVIHAASTGRNLTFCRHVPRNDIDRWCECNHLSPSQLLMAAFTIVLSRLCQERRVAFATLSHGRNRRQLRSAYGMFVKTVPMAIDVDPEAHVVDYMRSLRPLMTASVRHAAYPYFHFCRDTHQTAEISFAFQGRDIMEQVCVGGEQVDGRQLPHGDACNDMSCVIYVHDETYEIRMDASSGRRAVTELRMFAEAMDCCLHDLLRRPTCRVGEVELVDESERQAIVLRSRGQSRGCDLQTTFIGMFSRQASLSPQAMAVSDGQEHLTYAQLSQQSAALAGWLQSQGVTPGHFVAIRAVPCCAFLTAVLAVMRAGAAYVPVDTTWPVSYRHAMLSDVGVKVHIDPAHLPDVSLDTDRPATDLSTAGGLAYMMFTSGTTGRPKGVMIPHRALSNLIYSIVHHWHLQEDSRVSCHSSLAFDASVEDLYPVLTVGGTVYMMPEAVRHDLDRIHDFIDRHRITGGCYTTQLGMLIGRRHHPTLDYLCLGGERMTEVPSVSCRVINTYGPTECCVDATYYELEMGRTYETIPIGRPLDNTGAFVTDQYGRLLPWGAVGELCLSGAQLADGYWGDCQLTEKNFTPCDFSDGRIYHTGDRVRWNDEGLLEYVGRMGQLVKVNGYRVSLDEVERLIGQLASVRSVCVIPIIQGGITQLCAYYTSDVMEQPSRLTAQLREICPAYMIPVYWKRMDELPVLSNGKTDRRRLPLPEREQQRNYAAPQTAMERQVCEAFAKVLQTELVGVDDDFFQMGGTSLTAMSFMAEMHHRGYAVEYGSLFRYPSPRQLARSLEGDIVRQGYCLDGSFQHIHDYLAGAPVPPSPLCQSVRGKVLLTGATGFLGIHVLQELLDTCQEEVCCVVRASSGEEAMERLSTTYAYYYHRPLTRGQRSRIRVVAADLTHQECLSALDGSGISQVINCAANVRHFAIGRQLHEVNTEVVRRLADFCDMVHAQLVQVSTLSIAGLYDPSCETERCLTERDFYIGQHLGDDYTYSKWMAERLLLERMAGGQTDAVILRVGNLSSRSYDGQTQQHPEGNSLRMSLQLFEQWGIMPRSVAGVRVDLSPVDIVAKAVCHLALLNGGLHLWHVADTCRLTMQEIMALRGVQVDVVDDEIFEKQVEKTVAGQSGNQAVLSAMVYRSIAKKLMPHRYDSSVTARVLQKLGVTWPADHLF